MPSERVQRQIEDLLNEAEAAIKAREWARVRDRASAVVALDEENEDALAYLEAAETNLAPVMRRKKVRATRAKGPAQRRETCQIQWGQTSQLGGIPLPGSQNYFWADANSPVLGAYPAGCSPKFVPGFKHGLGQTFKHWGGYAYDPSPPATDNNTLAAHKALVDLLLAE